MPKKFKTFHFTHAAVDVFFKKEELDSELHCRVYYCLFRKKMNKIEIYDKVFFFSPIINKKDRWANF